MSAPQANVSAGGETRRFGPEAFPLSLGGDGCTVALEGVPAGRRAAHIGCAEGHYFVQPADPMIAVLHGDRLLGGSAWLRDGDTLSIAGTRLACRIADGALNLDVHPPAPEADRVAPPHTPPPAWGEKVPVAAPPARRRRRPRRWLAAAVLAVFGILVLAAVFVFTAVPVRVAVEPAPQELRIRGTLPVVKVGERYLMFPGEYRLVAAREGYHRLEETFRAEDGGPARLAFSMRKLPGEVSIRTEPRAGVRVSVDGRFVGVTPLDALALEAGTRQVELEAERYLPEARSLAVEGMGREQSLEVTLTPAWAPVTLRSTPPGAEVRIDGERAGATPLTLDLMRGAHVAQLTAPRHDPARIEFEVTPDTPLELPEVHLVPTPATLTLTSDPDGATVTVDGEYRGTTPLDVGLTPDEPHELVVAKSGHESVRREVTLGAAQSEALALELAPRYGTVFLAVQPADAELYVNGEARGSATRRLRLTVRPHRLELRREGYEPRTLTVTPRGGLTQTIKVTLDRAGAAPQAAQEASPRSTTTGQGQELRRIDPGRFTMGASRREQGRRANENLREVALTRAFYLGVHEVTNAEFRRFRPGHTSGTFQGLMLNDDRQPVVNVTWDDAAAYLNWLSERDGLPPAYERGAEGFVLIRPPTRGYRLPTEAEWAYAARVAAQDAPVKYPWKGGYPPADPKAHGNYADRSARDVVPATLPDYDDGHPVSAPVGSFAPNPAGIHDLGGNVAEWTNDVYALYPNTGSAVAADPLGPEQGKHHTVRGSSWRHAGISELRASYRDYASEARPDLGFRIARYVD